MYIIMEIHKKLIANISLNREKFKAFLLKSGRIQGCTLSVHIQYGTWSLNKSNKTNKGDQGDIYTEKEETKVLICRRYDFVQKRP